jgi:hypothetical protein
MWGGLCRHWRVCWRSLRRFGDVLLARARMGFQPLHPEPGFRPGGRPTFFAPPKKVGKERRAPTALAPWLRQGVPCCLRQRRSPSAGTNSPLDCLCPASVAQNPGAAQKLPAFASGSLRSNSLRESDHVSRLRREPLGSCAARRRRGANSNSQTAKQPESAERCLWASLHIKSADLRGPAVGCSAVGVRPSALPSSARTQGLAPQARLVN